MIKHLLSPLAVALVFTLMISCKWEPVEKKAPFGSPDYKKINTENAGRDIWQKPEKVIEKMGDISNKTIADIGAGTGYFTFRLSMKASKVIAVDIDPDMIDLINAFKLNLPVELKEKIEARLATPMDPHLKENEADIIVMINTIMYVQDKDKYLSRIFELLPASGSVMIVDYKSKNIPVKVDQGDYVISEEVLIEKLKSIGFDSIAVDNNSLEYQYVLYATKQ